MSDLFQWFQIRVTLGHVAERNLVELEPPSGSSWPVNPVGGQILCEQPSLERRSFEHAEVFVDCLDKVEFDVPPMRSQPSQRIVVDWHTDPLDPGSRRPGSATQDGLP